MSYFWLRGQDAPRSTGPWYNALLKGRSAITAQFFPYGNPTAQRFEIGDRRVNMRAMAQRNGGTNAPVVYVRQYRGGRNTVSSQYSASLAKFRQTFLAMMTGGNQ